MRTCKALLSAGTILGLAAAATAPAFAQAVDPAITVALAVEPNSVDACDTQPADNANVSRGNIYQSLTHVKWEDGTIESLLADSWTQVDDLTWEFKLKPGVKFHDGSDFNAEVAAANIMRVQAGFEIDGAAATCLNSGQIPDPITAEAVDELTLRVVTSKPDPILPLRLSYVDMGGLSTQLTAEKTTQPVGTGPYQFVERIQGTHIKLTRFDGYWGDAPQIKDVTYVYRGEVSVRAGMIQTGEAQIATAISAEHATDDDRTVEYKDNRIVLTRLMPDKEPFVDPRVRQAISKAIDRDTLVSVLMGRTGSPWYQFLSPQVNGYIPDFDTGFLAYDMTEAQALVDAAKADGHDIGAEFLIVTRPDIFPGSAEVVQAMAQSFESLGLKPKIVSLENTAWLQYLRKPYPAEQPATMMIISHDNTSGDASFSFPKYITCDGNLSSTCNEAIDGFIAQAEVSKDAERATNYQEAAKLLYTEETTMFGIAEQVRLMMLAENVNYEVNPLSGLEILIADVTID